jgi:hypothetical protein
MPDFKTYCKVTVTKTLWCKDGGCRDTCRQIEENRDSGINPPIYSQLISDKGTKRIQWGRNNIFNKWCWNNCLSKCKKRKGKGNEISYLIPYTKIN